MTTPKRSASCSDAPFTVIVKLADPVLPALSVAEQTTVVIPMGNTLPEAGVQPTVGVAGFSCRARTGDPQLAKRGGHHARPARFVSVHAV